jgi:ATP-dependent helicase/DNAse subunit B
MSGRIELHYSSDLSFLLDNFFKIQPDLFEDQNAFLYLVHTSDRAQNLKEKFYFKKSNNIACDYPFSTYQEFYQKLFTQLNIPSSLITYHQKLLLMLEIFKTYQDDLLYFDSHHQLISPQIIRGIQKYFDEVRLNDSDSLLLNLKYPRLTLTSSDKLQHDLQLLFSLYLRRKGKKYIDEPDLLKAIILNLDHNFLNNYYRSLKYVVFEDVSFFRSLHFRFIEHLKYHGLNIYLLLPYGKNLEIYLYKKPLFNKLRSLSDHIAGYQLNNKLSKSLFQIRTTGVLFSEKIRIYPAPNRLKEVENTAGEIKKQVLDHKWRYSDVCLITPQLKSFQPLIESVFQRYKIPYTLQENKLLTESSIFNYIYLLLNIVHENYPLLQIKKLLYSPFFIYRDKLLQGTRSDPLSYVRVKSGKKQIIDALNRQKDFYEERSDEMNLAASDYEVYIDVLLEFFDDIRFLEFPKSAKVIYRYFLKLFEKHRILEKIHHQFKDDEQHFALENFSAIQQLLSSLQEWVEAVSNYQAKRKFSIRDLIEIFTLLSQIINYKIKAPRNYGVQIFSVDNIRYQKFKAVYIIGMEDGVFPGRNIYRFANTQNLPNKLKHYLIDDYLLESRELFLDLLQYPAEVIQFSYSRFHQDKPVLPSIFLRELVRLSISRIYKEIEVCLVTPSDILQKLQEHGKIIQKIPDEFITYIPEDLLNNFKFRADIVKIRDSANENSSWEGDLSKDALLVTWLGKYYENTHFSPTQLEIYAKCPMLYFFQRVIKVQPEEEAEEFLTPLDRGILLHRILFRFYKSTLSKSLDTLISIAEEELKKIPIPGGFFWQIEKEKYVGGPDHKGFLSEFWDYENEIASQFLTLPKHFEWSYGNLYNRSDEVDEYSVSMPFVWEQNGKKIYLKGKIDRIEISEAGHLLVIDYKTGNPPSLSEMWNGEKLQLPIYLRAAQEMLKKQYPQISMGGGAFYVLRLGKGIEKKIVFLDGDARIVEAEVNKRIVFPNDTYQLEGVPQTLRQFTDRSLHFALTYIDGIQQGSFTHTRDENNCRRWDGKFCEFLPICRVRWKRASQLNNNTSSQ